MHPRIKTIEMEVRSRSRIAVILPTPRVVPTRWAMDMAMHGIPLGMIRGFLFTDGPSPADGMNYGLQVAKETKQDYALFIQPLATVDVWNDRKGWGAANMLLAMKKYPEIELISPSNEGFHDNIRPVKQGSMGFFMLRMSALEKLDAETYGMDDGDKTFIMQRYFVDDDLTGGTHFSDLCATGGVQWWQLGSVQCAELDGDHFVEGYTPVTVDKPSVLAAG